MKIKISINKRRYKNELWRRSKKNSKRNEKFLKEFEEWLNGKNLTDKTINKHISNVDLYINDYLTYYEVKDAEKGVRDVTSFLGGWFIEKCLWASKTSIKDTAASLKKFYCYMNENGYVSDKDYKNLCKDVKDGMEDILDDLEAFDNGTYWDMFM